ncbi:MAG: hypothetical protein R3A48_04085 [Polyangiales bacterium]
MAVCRAQKYIASSYDSLPTGPPPPSRKDQVSHWSISRSELSNWPTCSDARSLTASPTARKSTWGSAIPLSIRDFMNVGSSVRARRSGIFPMDPVTSRAKTIPRDSGCVGLSRHSLSFTPKGFMSG